MKQSLSPNWVNFHHELSSGKKKWDFPFNWVPGKICEILLQTKWSNYHPDSQRNIAPRCGHGCLWVLRVWDCVPHCPTWNYCEWWVSDWTKHQMILAQKLLILSYTPSRKSARHFWTQFSWGDFTSVQSLLTFFRRFQIHGNNHAWNSKQPFKMDGTPNNPLKWMFGETTIFHVKILNHPIETTVYKWMFQVRGVGVSQKRPNSCFNTKHQTKNTPKNGAPSDPQKIQPNTSTHNSSVRRWDLVV